MLSMRSLLPVGIWAHYQEFSDNPYFIENLPVLPKSARRNIVHDVWSWEG